MVYGGMGMGNKVAFDYSKATCFVSENEVDLMKKLTLDAKELLLSRQGDRPR